jgi:uncharacterized membrane protein YeiH
MPPLAPLPDLLSYTGCAVFAATGAIAAARCRHDVITFAFFAALTGLGGGTIRDLLLGAPIVWIGDPNYLTVCVVTGVAVWLIGYRDTGARALLWLDAVGLAAFAVMGAAKAHSLGVAAPVAILMGALTATAGGIIRDVVAGEPSVLLNREIYVTAAALASAVFVFAQPFAGDALADVAGFVAGLALRVATLLFHWSLPPYFGGVVSRLSPRSPAA